MCTWIDVRDVAEEYLGDDPFLKGTWKLHNPEQFDPDDDTRDYWNGHCLILSFGRDKDGNVFASTDPRFYVGEDVSSTVFPYECIWLR